LTGAKGVVHYYKEGTVRNMKTLYTPFLIATISLFPILWKGEAFSFVPQSELRQGLTLPTSEEIISLNTEGPIDHFSRFYSEAFQKTLDRKHLGVAIYFNDLSQGYIMTTDDPWMLEEAEEQARRLAREALYVAIQDTVNDVHIFHRVKEYGKSLTSAEVQVKDGELDFEGPSLSRAGRGLDPQGDPSRQDFFRSRLMVSAGVDLGLSWRTTLGPIESRLTYFVFGNDLWDATLSRRLTSGSKLDLSYRTGSDEQRAIVTLNFSLP
jgi:hypothetical protein